MNDENEWLEKYFKRVYATSYPTEMEYIFQAIEIKVTEEMNTTLVRELTSTEIKQALDQMCHTSTRKDRHMTITAYP